MKIFEYPERNKWSEILQRPAMDQTDLELKILSILNQVKEYGDEALKELTLKFDKVQINHLEVSAKEISASESQLSEELKKAIAVAAGNIEKFHLAQQQEVQKIETSKGVVCWRKNIAISKVGLYIPGGTAPLFSTILMLAIPAKIAGCKEIVLCTPPDENGNINPAILYAAHHTGIKKIYKVGGAQAIAAMAYGTQTIPQVYKIFGPGNQFVTAAKQLVSREGVAIDMPAGPSEVAVLADASCNPSYVAADLLSQAEHGKDSQVLLVSTDKHVVDEINKELKSQLAVLPRKDIASVSLKKSMCVLVHDMNEAMDLLNEYAPEHLILQVKDYMKCAEMVVNAGSVFLGHYTPEAAGDYASGTNHTLPTNGYARAYSGVSLDSFVKKVTFQEISKEGILNLGPAIEKMAEAEQLHAHKNAVSVRLK